MDLDSEVDLMVFKSYDTSGGGTGMAFAYFDQYGVFHIVGDADTAAQYSRDGRYVAVDVPHEAGYPTIIVDGKPDQLVIYDRGNGKFEGYVKGNQKGGQLVSPEAYAHLHDVLNQLV